MLRAENDSLKNENFRLQAAIRNVICPSCGGPAMLGEMSFDEQHLRLENARLKEEVYIYIHTFLQTLTLTLIISSYNSDFALDSSTIQVFVWILCMQSIYIYT